MIENRKKSRQNNSGVSLIPVIERQEEQFRKELEQTRREAESQISRAQELAEQHIQQSRQSISKLIEQTRKERLAELQNQAEQLSQSSQEHREYLQQQKEKNMAKAVQRLVDAVMTVGGQT